MSDPTFAHYARELHFIRELMEEFGTRHPEARARLLFSGNHSTDPHVEKVLQSFALLCGRAHKRIHDEFPEVSHAILNTLYPHYLAPVPSVGTIQFQLNTSGNLFPQGFAIHRGSQIRSSPVDGQPCKFRTVYPVMLWPLELAQAKFQPPPFPQSWQVPQDAAAVLRLEFRCLAGMRLSKLEIENHRLHLVGDPVLVPQLYELLFHNAIRVDVRAVEPLPHIRPVTLFPEECLFQVGFDPAEGLLPYPSWCLSGYRLLTEFFTYPDKFLYFDLRVWSAAKRAGIGAHFEVDIFFDRTMAELEQVLDSSMFAEGATPIINLFEHSLERLSVDSVQEEYNLVPDSTNPKGFEIYSIESITCTDPNTESRFDLPPYLSARHGSPSAPVQVFWDTTRYPSRKDQDNGTDVLLTLIDLHAQPTQPPGKTLAVEAICTNRDLPVQLSKMQGEISWDLEAAAPLTGIRTVRRVRPPLRLGERRGRLWHLVSHLLLNYLSLDGSDESLRTLQEILRLYDVSNPELGQPEMGTMNRHILEGIVSLRTQRVVGRLSDQDKEFVRGLEITVSFDELKYRGTGVFLFASILERFFPGYVSANSFSQLVATSTLEGGLFKRWLPRRGHLALV
ncbi:MAG: type VI secretion system baseplate subunit TssF [Gemmataceae bacterium]